MYDARTSYLENAVATASPARLVTLLYDRLLLDLDRAAAALGAGDRDGGRRHVDHAQDVVSELMSSLDPDAWEGGPALMQLYTFVMSELLTAGATGDTDKVAACRELVAPLAEAWHEAAEQAAEPAAPVAPATPGGLLGIG
ncbi:flagellar export chaperone FliS [Puerhibacterium puerhi]|uniref:flagellar export chaperone FliS n=1 Tax=Puerhibacterium puerhi TaxID=2692623 RepID=UPI001358A5FF|nr:flagellar export chaperone FliS [Puerhibacterium puerhi]